MPKQIDITKLDQRIKDALLALLEGIEKEDEYVRLQQMRQFKKNNLFWHGFQYLFWSESSQDWRIPTHTEFEELEGREETHYIFDYVVNVFKAHGESIIAALSADIPDVRFGPRDAQDPDDCRAVEAADNCVELIQKWNRAKLVIINALFYLATEGFVASYTYNKKDPTFGTKDINVMGTEPQETSPPQNTCEACGYTEDSRDPVQGASPVGSGDPGGMPSGGDQENPEESSEETPDDETQEPLDQQNVQQANKPCPSCGSPMTTEPGVTEEVPVLIGSRPIPKGREIIEVYGALSVRCPSYTAKQADMGYLIHYVDADPALFKEAFPDVADEIESDSGQSYERSMRQSSLTMEGYTVGVNLSTQKRCWLRPWMINRLGDTYEDIRDQIKKIFSTGCYFSVIGSTICEGRNESMDRHWTITKAGPSKGIHADPLLQSIVPLQEIHNNLTNLFVMQVEYGVPATYADTEVFDFQGQSRQEVSPGYIYPVKPRPGQSIGDSFYTEKTTTLSKEATQLLGFLKESEEFCSGSFPSIYGGPSVSGSKTLGEYDRSRSFALQRLSLVWYFINVWWGETVHKALLSFIDHQIEDEPITTKSAGGFQTKWIRQAELKGSFDRLEPDVSADFPTSFAQKRQLVMQLAQLANPAIDSVLYSAENAPVMQAYMGLHELKIPGELQRQKQMREILQLIGFEPQDDGQGNMTATVPIEPDIDDDDVHIEVLTMFLIGDTGQDLKKENIQGYANCLAHLVEHKQHQMMTMMPTPGAPPPAPGMNPPGAPSAPKSNGAPAGGTPPKSEPVGVQ